MKVLMIVRILGVSLIYLTVGQNLRQAFVSCACTPVTHTTTEPLWEFL